MQVWRGSLSIFDQDYTLGSLGSFLLYRTGLCQCRIRWPRARWWISGSGGRRVSSKRAALSPSMRQVAAYIAALPSSSRRWTGWRAARAPSRSPGCFHRLGFSVRDVPASAAVACGVGVRQHESGWAKLPVELLRKMLQALQAAEQWAPQGQRLVGARPRRRRGWCAVDGSAATMRW
jgi:hypothetical protein